jgi:hypothetical protein
MGAWGVGSLENDSALDWLGFFEDQPDLGLLESTFAAVADAEEDDYLEVDEASSAIAAAELVAFAMGHPGPELSDTVTAWIAQHRVEVAALAPLAVRALERVANDSEVAELWEETTDNDAWLADVEGLIGRIQPASA